MFAAPAGVTRSGNRTRLTDDPDGPVFLLLRLEALVDGAVGHGVCGGVELSRDVVHVHLREQAEQLLSFLEERSEPGVADAVDTLELPYQELAVREHLEVARAQLGGLAQSEQQPL